MEKQPITIRRLTPADAPRYRRLRLRALKESPTSYGRSHGEELKEPLSYFRKKLKATPSSWMFGAVNEGKLVAMIRLERDTGKKERHKGGIFGLYVEPRERGQGVARLLIQTSLAKARELGIRQLRLGVVATNKSAVRLYEKAGFTEYGREEDSLRVAGKFYAEILMARKL